MGTTRRVVFGTSFLTVAAQRAAAKSATTKGISLSRSVRASPASSMIVDDRVSLAFFSLFCLFVCCCCCSRGQDKFFCCCIYLFRRLAVLSRIFFHSSFSQTLVRLLRFTPFLDLHDRVFFYLLTS